MVLPVPTSQTPIAPENSEEASLSKVIRALKAEIGDLAITADRLQMLIGTLLSDPLAMPDAKAVEQGQALDEIVQRLQALEMFLGALAPVLQPDWAVNTKNATQQLLLADVARRLAGDVNSRPINHNDRGSCDFF